MDFHAYVFYVNRMDLLNRSIHSFPDLLGDLTIVDNSTYEDELRVGGPLEAFRPPVPFTYAQSINYILADALERKVDFIVHFHSDSYSDNLNAVQELLEKVRGYKAEGRKWACAWTHYDLLWAVNPVALEDIGGWDINLPTYFGDQDARRRWTLAGWECVNTNIQGINHEGSATINSDPELQFLNAVNFPLHRAYYEQKWGAGPGNEVFTIPFNRQDLFGAR